MGFKPDLWRLRTAERPRIVLICPDCGHETPEYVHRLRSMTFYQCRGDDCDYRFELTARAEMALPRPSE
jgi:hypothetical protein